MIEGASLARRAGFADNEGSRDDTNELRTASPGSETRLTAFWSAGTKIEVTSSRVRVEWKKPEKAS